MQQIALRPFEQSEHVWRIQRLQENGPPEILYGTYSSCAAAETAIPHIRKHLFKDDSDFQPYQRMKSAKYNVLGNQIWKKVVQAISPGQRRVNKQTD